MESTPLRGREACDPPSDDQDARVVVRRQGADPPLSLLSGPKSAYLGSESQRVAALGRLRGVFALHRAVLIGVDESDLPSTRNWREPSGAGHV